MLEQGTLSAHEYPVEKIFSSDFAFSIPDYQRPYRWGVEQAGQLLEDLADALGQRQEEPYFLGSLVLVRQAPRDFDVIDGQQRLTTLTILLSVLRDLEGGDVRAELGAHVMEPGRVLAGIPPRPRLVLRRSDAVFFKEHVQEEGGIETLIALSDNAVRAEAQRRIRDNAALLHEKLSAWSAERRRSLAELITARTFLIVVTTPNLDSAHRIFSVMNARGLDLAPADIFKSMVIGDLSDESGYAQQWDAAEESLGTENFTELFRDIRTIVSGERARKELLKEFPDQVLTTYLRDDAAGAFIDNLLLPYAAAFERTIAQNFGPGSDWREVNRWLERLARIDNKDWRPAALWALRHHADDAGYLAAFLRKLERLAAVALLRGEYTTPRSARFLEVLRELKDGKGLAAPSLEPTPHELAEARVAIGGEVYRMQIQRARYVLLRLDELLAIDAGATYDHSVISIEHVLPQNPAPGSNWLVDFDEDARAQWTHRLGNLLLLNHRKNAQARNFEFATKKDRYFRGRNGSAVFALTTQVLARDVWTPETLEARQNDLVGVLVDEWGLN